MNLSGKLKLDATGFAHLCERVEAWISPAGQRAGKCDTVDFGTPGEFGNASLRFCDISECFSDNRFLFGVGLSPWPHDFALCGQPFEQRGKRMNEMIEIVRGLCGGGWFEYHGEFYDFGEISINPVPTRPLPVLLGGHSDAALRRAALHGDGWVHAGGDKDQLQPLLARLQEIRNAEGVHEKPFEIHVISMDAFGPDGIRRLEDQGVTGVFVGFRDPYDPSTAAMPVEDKVAAMNYYAETVISKL